MMKKSIWLVIMALVIGGVVIYSAFLYANVDIAMPTSPTPPPEITPPPPTEPPPKFPEAKIEERFEEIMIQKLADFAIAPVTPTFGEKSKESIKDLGLDELRFPSEDDKR